jgi:CRP/FNR family transcriptional regulator, cyclic AMP receptor protein
MAVDRREIAGLPFFEGMPEDELNLLTGLFHPEEFPSGHVIFRQDQSATRLYMLVQGAVAIRFKPPDGDELTVASISPGGVFGWSSALGRNSYTSSAITTEDSHAVSIPGQILRGLCISHPAMGVIILKRLAELIADRLSGAQDQIVDLLWQGIGHPKEPAGGKESSHVA